MSCVPCACAWNKIKLVRRLGADGVSDNGANGRPFRSAQPRAIVRARHLAGISEVEVVTLGWLHHVHLAGQTNFSFAIIVLYAVCPTRLTRQKLLALAAAARVASLPMARDTHHTDATEEEALNALYL